jgi:D-serine deaminase-like pyridoxal phosphate-dependent protein
VALDSEAVAEALDAAARDAGAALEWLWELDCGVGRCGTPPGEDTAERVAALAARTAHARFAGLLTFGGHSYRARDIHEIAAAAEDERSAVADTAAALEARGVPVPVRSVGSTPTAHVHRHPTGVTELRPGNYVYNDATQVALEVARPEDCALSVLATVVSHPTADRIILDAGSKALGADRLTERAPGFGLVADRLELRVERLYEEHAIVTSHFPIDLPVGARVCVVPNHACTAANLHARMLVTADGAHAEPWTISARLDGMEHDCHASTS